MSRSAPGPGDLKESPAPLCRRNDPGDHGRESCIKNAVPRKRTYHTLTRASYLIEDTLLLLSHTARRRRPIWLQKGRGWSPAKDFSSIEWETKRQTWLREDCKPDSEPRRAFVKTPQENGGYWRFSDFSAGTMLFSPSKDSALVVSGTAVGGRGNDGDQFSEVYLIRGNQVR